MQTIESLKTFSDEMRAHESISFQVYRETQEILQNYIVLIQAYNKNAEFVLQKIRGTAQLLLDTLNLKHQRVAHGVSENTLALADTTVNESVTVRVITIVTLIYLPTTFVAVCATNLENIVLNLTLADPVRHAILQHQRLRKSARIFITVMALFRSLRSFDGDHIHLLDVDGKEAEAKIA